MGKVKGTEKEEENILSNETGKLFCCPEQRSRPDQPYGSPSRGGRSVCIWDIL